MVLRFARNILPESKRHESKHLKKTNSNSAPLLKLLHLKLELFLFVLQSTRKNNDRIQTNIEQQFFFLIHIHTVHEMTPFSHQDAINKSSKIRKSKRTLKVTDRPARAFSRLGCVNTVTQLVYELYDGKV